MVLLSCCFGEEPERPACNAQTQGMIWRSRDVKNGCSEIDVCALRTWRNRYRWRAVTVDIGQLAKDPTQRRSCRSAETKNASLKDKSPISVEPFSDGVFEGVRADAPTGN